MNIHLVTHDDVPELSERLRAAPRVALDTEFHTEGRYLPQLLLVQLHLPGEGTFIVDPLQEGLLEALGPALLDARAWLVHAGRQDLRLLHHALGSLPDRVLDTQLAAGLVSDQYPEGFGSLVSRWLDEPLDKASTLSDWSQRPLDATQLQYAAEDVVYLPPLWDAILEAVQLLDREASVEAACEEARLEALARPDDAAGWRRAAGTSSLSPQEAAALRELVIWRERHARERDRPPHFILGDATLKQIARSRPATLEDLEANRRISNKTVKRHGARILEAVRAADRPVEECPRTLRRGSPEARALLWLEAFLAAEGHRARLAPRLVAPRDRLVEILLSHADPTHAVPEILGPWRTDLVGEALVTAFEGRASITLEGSDVRISANPPRLR